MCCLTVWKKQILNLHKNGASYSSHYEKVCRESIMIKLQFICLVMGKNKKLKY